MAGGTPAFRELGDAKVQSGLSGHGSCDGGKSTARRGIGARAESGAGPGSGASSGAAQGKLKTKTKPRRRTTPKTKRRTPLKPVPEIPTHSAPAACCRSISANTNSSAACSIRNSLPLNDKEVVITFDDGPLPPYTDQVLDILASQCVKATFFMVGEMARSFPATARRVYEEGQTIGTHSDHHPIGFGKLPIDRMHLEIDGGIADVSAAFGGNSRYLAPFFRIPGLERSDLLESELAARGLIIFSADVVADDWHRGITPAKIVSLAMSRLEARGKGILLLHDIHPKTVAALPGLLEQLKEQGFHVVQVVPSAAYEIAMARKPAARMLASAIPGELTIDDNDTVLPTWPQAADDRTPRCRRAAGPRRGGFPTRCRLGRR